MMNDAQLLQDYVKQHSQPAFTQLVERHVDLVYSTALRIVREPALAEDIVQMVFVQLMAKASTIRNGNTLPGWLYRVTHGQAVNALRAEQTRHRHEAEASMHTQTEAEVAWEVINPELDEAMARLDAEEQNVMVMRFFQDRPWREISTALAVSEDTAQRRARQGLQKLRHFFSGKGIAVSSSALGLAVSAHAVQAAPAGMASSVAGTALAQSGTVSLETGLLHTLFTQKAVTLWITLALVTGITTPIIYTQMQKASVNNRVARLAQGQVLHLAFDQDEDDQVTDSSGQNNHGQAIGAHWATDESRGGVFRFASREQYIRIPNSDSLNPSQITLAVWMKTSRHDKIWRRLFDKSYSEGYALSIGGAWTPIDYQGKAVIEIGMKLNRNRGITQSNLPVTDGQWHHVVTTYDGRRIRLYVDGMQQKQVITWAGEVPSNDHDLSLGMNLIDPMPEYDEPGESFDGFMDDAMIWNRALSQDEVKSLFQSQQ